MVQPGLNNLTTNVCDLKELREMMREKKPLILEIIDIFLAQIVEELAAINEAIEKTNYPIIKNLSHTMKSTVSIMGIVALKPILTEIESLSTRAEGIEKIKELGQQLILICEKAIEEMEIERQNYI